MGLVATINDIPLNISQMELVCSYHEEEFLPLAQEVFPHAKFYTPTDGRQLIYIDNNSPILGIAHLDGTMKAEHFLFGNHYKKNEMRVYTPFVDDRMGVFTLLHILPQMEIVPDILLTVGEEIGQSTAMFYNTEKQYNWMFQFDRKGTDAVHYQYMMKPWLDSLRDYWPDLTHGAMSDICYLDHLGCQGVNIGTGYHDYNWQPKDAYCSLNELTSQCIKFKAFFEEYKDTPFTQPRDFYSKPARRYGRGSFHMETDSPDWLTRVLDEDEEDARKNDVKYANRKPKKLKIKCVKSLKDLRALESMTQDYVEPQVIEDASELIEPETLELPEYNAPPKDIKGMLNAAPEPELFDDCFTAAAIQGK